MSYFNSIFEKYLILIIDSDDDASYCHISAYLPECKVIVKPYSEAQDFYSNNKPDLMILNHTYGYSCIEHLKLYKSINTSLPVVIMTDKGSEEFAVKVFRSGASDYLIKPLDLQELTESIRNVLGTENIKKRRKADYCSDFFRTAVQYIKGNYNQKITLPRIAKEAGMSISCFERTFKRNMGVTFVAYVNRLRISKALRMLKNKRFSASEIAFECGFANQYHFNRMFKKITKTCPRNYRKSLYIKKY